MSQRVVAARRAVNSAEVDLGFALQEDYPVGRRIRWVWNDQHYLGTVVMHGTVGRIKVVNSSTGKERWISAYHIAVPGE